jgi:hypothetical protein
VKRYYTTKSALGECPGCGRQYAVNGDGTVRWHLDKAVGRRTPCAGVGKPAATIQAISEALGVETEGQPT